MPEPWRPRRHRRLPILLNGGWHGFDRDETCNLCCIWRPSERSDERLLSMPTFEEMASTASLYRTRDEGRVLVEEWAKRHSEDVEELLVAARLAPASVVRFQENEGMAKTKLQPPPAPKLPAKEQVAGLIRSQPDDQEGTDFDAVRADLQDAYESIAAAWEKLDQLEEDQS